jgi:peptide/nickel transport system ATP-binding protein
MQDVGIADPEHRANQYAHELSGGLRQRALIASAIAAGPALVIADEPTTALDVTVQAQVLAVLAARLEQGVGVLLISHDLAVVAGVADRVLVMHNGEVVDSGTAESVLNNPSHPYTRQLLAAQPSAQSRGHRLSSARFVTTVAAHGKADGNIATQRTADRARAAAAATCSLTQGRAARRRHRQALFASWYTSR